jgi:hypothetical protein
LADLIIAILIIVCFAIDILFMVSLFRRVYDLEERNHKLTSSVQSNIINSIQSNSVKNKSYEQPIENKPDNSDLYKDPVTGLLSMKAYRMNVAKLKNGGDLSIEDINKGV